MDAPPEANTVLPLGEIRSQDRAVSSLRAAIVHNRVAHAYLFLGQEHAGKSTTALSFAAALNCDVAPGEGCGTCATCERIGAGNHPDVIRLERQGAQKIVPIGTIRDQVISRLGSAPHEARYRVFLFDEATALPGPAANALLKSLEEPPARTVFVLCTSAPTALLPTIRSRCQPILFSPRARTAESDIGPPFDIAGLRRALVQDNPATLLDMAQEIASDKGQAAPALRHIAEYFHKAAVESAKEGRTTQAQEEAKAAEHALSSEFAMTNHNAHAQLTLESLFFRLQSHLRHGSSERA